MLGSIMRILPLLFFVILAYIILRYLAPGIYGDDYMVNGVIDMGKVMASEMFTIPMVSGNWKVEVGALFVTFGLISMFIEVIRSTRTDAISITNHALSLVVLVFCLVLFIVVQGFATSVFFYLTVMALIDVVAGFTVSIIGARRDFGGTGLAV